MPFTTAMANNILNKILRNTDFTPATALWASLHTADPVDNGQSEVTGGSYARQSISFSAASSKTTSQTADLNFTLMPACTVTHVGLWSASSGGTFQWGGVLTDSKTITAGDTFKIGVSDWDVSLV